MRSTILALLTLMYNFCLRGFYSYVKSLIKQIGQHQL